MRYKAQGIPRRLFLGTGIGALSSKLAQPAEADTIFTDFRFAATGAPVGRTLPERLSDVVNVLDWGAAPGAGDDTAAIQAAIDFCISRGGGKVFFPPGLYLVSNLSVGTNNPAQADNGVQLIGSGHGSLLANGPSDTGWMISKGARQYDLLELVENLNVKAINAGANAGGIQFTRPRAIANNVYVIAWKSIDASQCDGFSLYGCGGTGPGHDGTDASSMPYHGFNRPGSYGVQLGNNSVAHACRWNACDIGFAVSGTGSVLTSVAVETNNVGVRVGWANGAEAAAIGCTISSLAAERNDIGIELYNCQGGVIANCSLYVAMGVPYEAPIQSMVWSAANGGTVMVTTVNPHNLKASPFTLSFPTITDGTWVPYAFGTNFFKATSTGPRTFTYPLPVQPNNPNGFVGTATWNYPASYSLRCRKVYETLITGCSARHPGKGSFDLDYADTPGNGDPYVQFRNVVFMGCDALHGWNLPTDLRQLAGCKFLSCTGAAFPQSLFSNNKASPSQMVFADLPGQYAVVPVGSIGPAQPAVMGQEYDITDGQAQGGGAAAWGGIVQGGNPGGNYLVRYDGTNWRRIG